MRRRQEGRIYERCDSFYVQYWTTEIVNGQPKRVQRSQFLANRDDKYYSKKSKGKTWFSEPLRLLRDEEMLKINQQAQNPTRANKQDMNIVEYYERVYLPFVEVNLRFSTVRGYKLIWNRDLKAHFSKITLREYRTHMGSLFLTDLARSYGRRTLAHVRSLASAIFSHAVNTGMLESNPWHDVRILGKVKAPKNTPHYTLEEVENIISALVDHDCQLAVALAFFLGLRPGEIEGLKWEDVDSESVHIRRASVYGKIGETKTPESVATLPLIQPVLIPMKLWHQKSGSPSEGWVFPNGRGKPVSMNNLQNRIIRPELEKKEIEWKGLYAGRRGAGTILTQLTGSAIAAQQILRHKNLAVTTGFYVKQIPSAGIEGMKLLEAAASNGNGKEAEGQR